MTIFGQVSKTLHLSAVGGTNIQTLFFIALHCLHLSEKSTHWCFFQNNQADVENATEVLSGYLERDISQDCLQDIKQKVQDKYRWAIYPKSQYCVLLLLFLLNAWNLYCILLLTAACIICAVSIYIYIYIYMYVCVCIYICICSIICYYCIYWYFYFKN